MNNNNNNDILFFKIFRNVAIKNKILFYIKDNNSYSNRDYNTIISLEWMLDNNLHSMIIDKLKSNHHIYINKKSIQKLIITNSNEQIIELILNKYFINVNSEIEKKLDKHPIYNIDLIEESVKLNSISTLKLIINLITKEKQDQLLNKWYFNYFKKNNNNNNSLLEIAIVNGNLEIADYLLSIDKLSWYSKSNLSNLLINHLKSNKIQAIYTNYNNNVHPTTFEQLMQCKKLKLLKYEEKAANYSSNFEYSIEFNQNETTTTTTRDNLIQELRNVLNNLINRKKRENILKKQYKLQVKEKEKQEDDKSVYKYLDEIFNFVENKLHFKFDELMYNNLATSYYSDKTINPIRICITMMCIERSNNSNNKLFNSIIKWFSEIKGSEFSDNLEWIYSEFYMITNDFNKFIQYINYVECNSISRKMVDCFYELVFIYFSIPALQLLLKYDGKRNRSSDIFCYNSTGFKYCFKNQTDETVIKFIQFINDNKDEIINKSPVTIPWDQIFKHLINYYSFELFELLVSNFEIFKLNLKNWIQNGTSITFLSIFFWCTNLKTNLLDTRFIDLFLKYYFENKTTEPVITSNNQYLNSIPSYNISNYNEKVKLINHLTSNEMIGNDVFLLLLIVFNNDGELPLINLLYSLFNNTSRENLQKLNLKESIEIYKSLNKENINQILNHNQTITTNHPPSILLLNYITASLNPLEKKIFYFKSLNTNINSNKTLENCLFDDLLLNEIFKKNHNGDYQVLESILDTIYGSGRIGGIVCTINSKNDYIKPIEIINYLISNEFLFSKNSKFGNTILVSIIERLMNEINLYDNQIQQELEIISFIKSLPIPLMDQINPKGMNNSFKPLNYFYQFLEYCIKKDLILLFKFFLNYYLNTTVIGGDECCNGYLINQDNDIYRIIKEYYIKLNIGKDKYKFKLLNELELLNLENNQDFQKAITIISFLIKMGEIDNVVDWINRNNNSDMIIVSNIKTTGYIIKKLIKSVWNINKIIEFEKIISKNVNYDDNSKKYGMNIYFDDLKYSHRIDIIKYFIKESRIDLNNEFQKNQLFELCDYPNSIKNEFLSLCQNHIDNKISPTWYNFSIDMSSIKNIFNLFK